MIRKFVLVAAAAAIATALLPPSSFAKKADKAQGAAVQLRSGLHGQAVGCQQDHRLGNHPALLLREPQDVCGPLSLLPAGRRVPRGHVQVEKEVVAAFDRLKPSRVGHQRAR